jgi:hypothetical protein
MGGVVQGIIEMLIPADNANETRDLWVRLSDKLDAHAAYTRIAGNFGAAATGYDLTGGANPAGENAFKVWLGPGFTICMQWSWGALFGAAPGNPGDVAGNFHLGIQVAYDTSMGANVWGGGTANAGADAKSTPVWVADGGNLVVHPRGNGATGTFAVNMEAFVQAVGSMGAASRVQFICDDDYLLYLQDSGNTGGYTRMLYIGPYTPASGVTVVGSPLCMLQFGEPMTVNSDIGSLSNGNAYREGGVAVPSGANGSRIARVGLDTVNQTALFQPDSQRAVPSYDTQRLALYVRDTNTGGQYGLLGYVDLIKAAYNVPTHDTNVGLTKAVFGAATLGSIKLVVDWDGVTLPGSGGTAAGVSF